jgi:hypothetical protein
MGIFFYKKKKIKLIPFPTLSTTMAMVVDHPFSWHHHMHELKRGWPFVDNSTTSINCLLGGQSP